MVKCSAEQILPEHSQAWTSAEFGKNHTSTEPEALLVLPTSCDSSD